MQKKSLCTKWSRPNIEKGFLQSQNSWMVSPSAKELTTTSTWSGGTLVAEIHFANVGKVYITQAGNPKVLIHHMETATLRFKLEQARDKEILNVHSTNLVDTTLLGFGLSMLTSHLKLLPLSMQEFCCNSWSAQRLHAASATLLSRLKSKKIVKMMYIYTNIYI